MRTNRELLCLVIRLILGALFLYAGSTKIADPTAFAGDIAAYRILPYFGNYLAAAIIPWIEAFCGILLIVGFRTRAAALLAIFLLLVFAAALASTIVRGLDIDCGCFRHAGEKTSAWTALVRDALLLASALYLLRRNRKEREQGTLRFTGK